MRKKTLLLTMYMMIIVIVMLFLIILNDEKEVSVSGKDKNAEIHTLAGLDIGKISSPTQSPQVTPSHEPAPAPTPSPAKKTKIEKPQPPQLDIPLSKNLQQYIFKQCEYDKDLYLIIISVIKTESDFDKDTVGIDGHDKGLMQVRDCNLESLQKKFGEVDLMDPYDNVKCGVYMFSQLYSKYEYKNLALMAYNCGEAGARKLWRREIYSTEYSRKVTEYYKSFKGKEGE